MCVSYCFSLSLPSLSLSLSLSLTTSRQKFVSKASVFKGCLPNTPTPRTPLQVSSSSRNFIRADFLYKLITPEGTSHLLSVWGWVGWNIFIRDSPMLIRQLSPPLFSFLFLSLPFFFLFFLFYFIFYFLLMLISKSDDKCTVKLCQ